MRFGAFDSKCEAQAEAKLWGVALSGANLKTPATGLCLEEEHSAGKQKY